ncbi:hypothetical protein [Paenibacillus harenae]|uniref:hypothetical protein n=1 Tax=Paenibacillus harenae TaxID=306543 RepID=UPI00278DAA9B|nr:hypothetical protein [Paenibacillus harenae]MDQ0063195.1 hypothetical protein [Paenibacillus harenae]
MDNIIKGKKFILYVMLILVFLLAVTASLGYIIDPNLYYRPSKFDTYYSEAYTTAGLMKNYPAEAAIIGSSMMQNTDLELVKKTLGVEAVKYTRSGMTVDEIAMLVDRATSLEKNQVNTFIINVDSTMFNNEKSSPYTKYPQYLYDDSLINDMKYVIGFETWTKFIPFMLIYNASNRLDNPVFNKLTGIFSNSTDMKRMGDWSQGTAFGEDIVINKYENNAEAVSEQNADGMFDRMKTRFESDLYPVIQKNDDRQFIFLLPPYSALYWYEAERKGYVNILFEFKKYMVARLSQLNNVVVYDYQDYEGIVDLNHYKDTTHYIPAFNDMMIKSLSDSTYRINEDNVDQRINQLKDRITAFKTNEAAWLNET